MGAPADRDPRGDGMSPQPAGPATGLERVLRGALLGLGALVLLRGAYLLLFGLPPRVWLPIALWLALGSVVHVLVLAPTSLLLGRTLSRLGRIRPSGLRRAGNALRDTWL